jgi:hypothetical protein
MADRLHTNQNKTADTKKKDETILVHLNYISPSKVPKKKT